MSTHEAYDWNLLQFLGDYADAAFPMPSLAHMYARGGFQVCRVTPGSKGAVDVDEQNRPVAMPPEAWTGAHAACGVGLLTSEEFFVVDIDGEQGEASAAWLSRVLRDDDFLHEKASNVVKTSRGRHHYFFRYTWGKKELPHVPNTVGLLPGIDIRGNGGMVLAPGSLHPSGVRYSAPHFIRPLLPPAELTALCKLAREVILPPQGRKGPAFAQLEAVVETGPKLFDDVEEWVLAHRGPSTPSEPSK